MFCLVSLYCVHNPLSFNPVRLPIHGDLSVHDSVWDSRSTTHGHVSRSALLFRTKPKTCKESVTAIVYKVADVYFYIIFVYSV